MTIHTFLRTKLTQAFLPCVALAFSVGCGSAPAPTPPETPTASKVEAPKDDPTAKVLSSKVEKKTEDDMFGGAVDTGGDTYEADASFKAPTKTKELKTSKPELVLGTPIVRGKADRDSISLVASKRQEALNTCFKKRIDTNGEAGTIIVSFAIKPNGGIDEITKTKSNLGDDKLDACVLATFAKMAFPSAKNTSKVNVVFPVLLTRP